MPVYNISQPPQIDLSAVMPKEYSNVASENVSIEATNTEPSELGFGDNFYTGDVVNVGSPEDRGPFFILPVEVGEPMPSKATVLDLGIPVLAGGSSYHIPEGSKLRFFIACSGLDADVHAQYFG